VLQVIEKMKKHLPWRYVLSEGIEGPIRRTREGGSEWEPIKILLEGDGNSYKMNTASNTRLLLTTQVGQAHVATGVPVDLGINTHNLPTRERSGTQTSSLQTHTGPTGEHHRSDRSLLVKLSNFHKVALHRSDR
jgi:hypothetical protein